MRKVVFPLLVAVVLPLAAQAAKKEVCMYILPDGRAQQVRSLGEVPVEYRPVAKCFEERANEQLSKPGEIELEGTVRQVHMSSSVGQIHLRWPRKVELLFGRTPERAMADAARTVSRTLKQAGFPPALRNLDIEWNVVFMDQNLPEQQIPSYLVYSCHPGWMTPPANIYLVAQRVANGCSSEQTSRQVSDGRLTQVLLHEMGHVVENQLLGDRFGTDRMRAEGFACWFEQYAANNSSVVSGREVEREYLDLARRAVERSPNAFVFRGSAEDYARAALFFRAVAGRRGAGGVVEIYETMERENLNFVPALMKRMGWGDRKLGEELTRALKGA